ncbi:MAG TPA: hypothetical protein VGW38_17720 [Chloroflexota bacterium]|nr:hypothetical protein [Chloroflexota bacterium]
MDAHEQLHEYIARLSRVADELESITRGLAEFAEQTDIRFGAEYEGFDEEDELDEDDIRPDKPTY